MTLDLLMTRHLKLMLVLALGHVQLACAAPQCTPQTETDLPLCRNKIPRIAEIVIEENAAGKSDPNDPTAYCSQFVLTKDMVRVYLARAKRVADGTPAFLLDWSPCRASGKLKTKGGRSGEWTIWKSRAGILLFTGESPQQLYWPDCTGKKWPRQW